MRTPTVSGIAESFPRKIPRHRLALVLLLLWGFAFGGRVTRDG